MPYAGGDKFLFRFTGNIAQFSEGLLALGEMAGSVKKAYMALSGVSDGKEGFKSVSGGYFSPAAGSILVSMLKREIVNPSLTSWEPYSDRYSAWKQSSGWFANKGPWLRTGTLRKAITFLNTASSKGAIGFDRRVKPATPYGFGGKDRGYPYSIETIAERLEYGFSGNTPGMPARPLFTPVTKVFVSREFPNFANVVQRMLDDIFAQKLQLNVSRLKNVNMDESIGAANQAAQEAYSQLNTNSLMDLVDSLKGKYGPDALLILKQRMEQAVESKVDEETLANYKRLISHFEG